MIESSSQPNGAPVVLLWSYTAVAEWLGPLPRTRVLASRSRRLAQGSKSTGRWRRYDHPCPEQSGKTVPLRSANWPWPQWLGPFSFAWWLPMLFVGLASVPNVRYWASKLLDYAEPSPVLTLSWQKQEYFAAVHIRLIVRWCARLSASSEANSCAGASSSDQCAAIAWPLAARAATKRVTELAGVRPMVANNKTTSFARLMMVNSNSNPSRV